MTNFTAGTQYGDWKGTASADEFIPRTSFEKLFEATGKVDKENDVLIGFEFYAEEEFFFLAGYYHPKSSSNPNGWGPSLNDDFNRTDESIRIQKIEIKLTLEQFFKYFKRFNVVMIKKGLDIIGRDYDEITDV
jgi:hypothetical protein